MDNRRPMQQQTAIGYPVILPPVHCNPTTTTTSTATANYTYDHDIDGSRMSTVKFCLVNVVLPIVLFVPLVVFLYLAATYSTRTLNFKVDSLRVDDFNLSYSNYSHISANWNIIFSATDPQFCGFLPSCLYRDIHYEDVEVSISYKSENISSTAINSPLFQYLNNDRVKLIHANIPVAPDGVHIDSSIADGIATDWKKYGAVNFTVTVEAVVEIEDGDRDWSHRMALTASCEQVMVGFSSNMTTGTMLDAGSRTCETSLVHF